MRKRIVGPQHTQQGAQSDTRWLDLGQIATVEATSEDPRFPIENAFGSNDGPGWRASQGGKQQIRIIFDKPVSVHRMELCFHEANCERTQEFVLRWSSESGGSVREVVRQQWNFSPNRLLKNKLGRNSALFPFLLPEAEVHFVEEPP
jgi:hypothetical protein